MFSLLKKSTLGVALASTALMAAAPVQAREYRHHDNGAAIVVGALGIAALVALASSHHDDRYDGYDGYDQYDGYYGSRYNGGYHYQNRSYDGRNRFEHNSRDWNRGDRRGGYEGGRQGYRGY